MDLICSLYRGMQNIAFWKRKDYSYQNEIRMIIPKFNSKLDHIEINIGDISGISRVYDTESLLQAKIRQVMDE